MADAEQCQPPTDAMVGGRGLAAELRAAQLEEYQPDIYRRARAARQRTCPIGELIGPDREDRYKSTMRWDIKKGEKAKYLEDASSRPSPGSPTPPTAAPSSSASPTTATSTASKTTTTPSPSEAIEASEATTTSGPDHPVYETKDNKQTFW